MAIAAAAWAVEESFAGFEIAGEQFFDRVSFGNTRGLDSVMLPGVKIRNDVRDLFGGHINCGHAFVGAALMNDGADQIAFDVMCDERRANQIGAAGAGGVSAVAESAGLLKLLVAPGDLFFVGGRRSLGCGIPSGHESEERNKQNRGAGKFRNLKKLVRLWSHVLSHHLQRRADGD
jgi:hypothetical protein